MIVSTKKYQSNPVFHISYIIFNLFNIFLNNIAKEDFPTKRKISKISLHFEELKNKSGKNSLEDILDQLNSEETNDETMEENDRDLAEENKYIFNEIKKRKERKYFYITY